MLSSLRSLQSSLAPLAQHQPNRLLSLVSGIRALHSTSSRSFLNSPSSAPSSAPTRSPRATSIRSKMSISSNAAAAESSSATSLASVRALVFDTPGEPLDVLSLRELPTLAKCGPGQVQLRFLQSPINPSDINTVQGKYPIMPQLPAGVPGHEGLAEVAAVGPEVTSLAPGDWVVPLRPRLGTWRTAGTYAAADWHRVPRDIGMAAAATLVINPPSALAMLENFVQLQEGDTVAQNGATSAVGEAVIQIARARGIKTINIIRERPDMAATVAHLTALGADLVTTEEKLKDDLKASGLPAPRLGLNCVGGSAALAVSKILADGGTLVTYGGMAMQNVTAGTAAMIFKDISFRGFWLSGRWSELQGLDGRAASLDRIVSLYQAGKLQPPAVAAFPLGRWQEAFKAVATAHRGRKVVLDMTAAE